MHGEPCLLSNDFIDNVMQSVACKKCFSDLDYAVKEVVGEKIHLHVACKKEHLWHHISYLSP